MSMDSTTSSNTSTPLSDRVLEHLVKMARVDKQYSWWSAKNFAAINPFDLADIPDRLKKQMLQEKQ